MLAIVLLIASMPLLTAASAEAAIAEVGGGSQRVTGSAGNFASTTQAFPGNVTANNLMACGGNIWNSPAITGLTITDTRSSAWTVVLGPATGEFVPFVAYAIVPSSGAVTVTIAPTGGGNYGTWSCDEFSGTATASVLDADGGSTTATTTTPSDAMTTTTENALILGLLGNNTNTAAFLAAGSGYTQIGEVESASWAAHLFEFRIGTTAAVYTVDATMSSAVSSTMQTLSLTQASVVANQPMHLRGGSIPGMNSLGLGGPLP